MPRIKLLILLLFSICLRAQLTPAQVLPTPLQITNIFGVAGSWVGECAPHVVDNRSVTARNNDYHSVSVSAGTSYSVSLNWSDTACTGPWTSFGPSGAITQASNPLIAFGFGNHKFIQISITGNAVVTYSASHNYFLPPGGSGGGISFPITTPQGGTGQTTFPAGEILVGNGPGALATIPMGSANRILGVNIGGTANEYKILGGGANISISAGAGILSIGVVGLAQSAYTDTTNADNITTGHIGAGLLPATVVLNNQNNTYSAGSQNFTAASHFIPKHGTGLPGACSGGEVFIKDDATPGQQWYFCNPDNVWTQQLNTGGASSVSAFNSRTGAVLPITGDYSFAQIAGVASLAQIPTAYPYANLAGSPTIFYQTLQAATVNQTQRNNLNFSANFTLADNSGASRSTVELAAVISPNTTGTAAGLTGYTIPGTGTQLATFTGSGTNGHCVAFGPSNNMVDNGTACGSGGGGGTVTSVGLLLPVSTYSISGSPVATTGTLTAAFINQSANTFLGGPGSGIPATPSWRALVLADIPSNYPYSSLAGAPTIFYQTVQSNTANQTQRLNLNFSSELSVTDVPASNRTTIAIAPAGVTNAMLVNSAVTVTPGTGLNGGGSVALGSVITLNLAVPVAIANGGTASTTAASAFNALSPMTTLGDAIVAGAAGARQRLGGDTTNARTFWVSQSISGAPQLPFYSVLTSPDIPNNAANTSGTAAGITGKTFTGPGAKIPTSTGSYTSGDCVSIDASSNFIDAATPCGGLDTTKGILITDKTNTGVSAASRGLHFYFDPSSSNGFITAYNAVPAPSNLSIVAGAVDFSGPISVIGSVLAAGYVVPTPNTYDLCDPTVTCRNLYLGTGFKIGASQTITGFGGNAAKLGTTTGTLTSGHGVSIDANGNFIDSGSSFPSLPLSVANGGLSFSSYTAGDIPVASGATAFVKLNNVNQVRGEIEAQSPTLVGGCGMVADGATDNASLLSACISNAPGPVTQGTYTSGIAATGALGQTCVLTFTGGTAIVSLTNTNTIASGSLLNITSNSLVSSAPTTATVASGTASCTGPAAISTALGGPTIHFASGIYAFNSGVTVTKDNVALLGNAGWSVSDLCHTEAAGGVSCNASTVFRASGGGWGNGTVMLTFDGHATPYKFMMNPNVRNIDFDGNGKAASLIVASDYNAGILDSLHLHDHTSTATAGDYGLKLLTSSVHSPGICGEGGGFMTVSNVSVTSFRGGVGGIRVGNIDNNPIDVCSNKFINVQVGTSSRPGLHQLWIAFSDSNQLSHIQLGGFGQDVLISGIPSGAGGGSGSITALSATSARVTTSSPHGMPSGTTNDGVWIKSGCSANSFSGEICTATAIPGLNGSHNATYVSSTAFDINDAYGLTTSATYYAYDVSGADLELGGDNTDNMLSLLLTVHGVHIPSSFPGADRWNTISGWNWRENVGSDTSYNKPSGAVSTYGLGGEMWNVGPINVGNYVGAGFAGYSAKFVPLDTSLTDNLLVFGNNGTNGGTWAWDAASSTSGICPGAVGKCAALLDVTQQATAAVVSSSGSSGVASNWRFPGQVYVGTEPLNIPSGTALEIAGSGLTFLPILAYGSGGSPGTPAVRLFAARGTAGAMTAIQSGDVVGAYTFGGSNGVSGTALSGSSASIAGVSLENYSGSVNGTEIDINTVAIGSTTNTKRVGINENGIDSIFGYRVGANVGQTFGINVAGCTMHVEKGIITTHAGASCP